MSDELQRLTDPSTLTTQLVWREVTSLKELLESRIAAVEKGIVVAHDDLVRVPTEVQAQVGNLKELHEEKFRSIQLQFGERDTRVETTAKDNKDALAAALQAAKELVTQQNTMNSLAVSKSESATTKQIDQLGVLIQTVVKATDEKFDDLKQRVTRMEGAALGSKDTKTDQRDMSRYIVAVVGLLFAILAFVVGRGGLR